jgi:hypothetical protein
MATALYLKDIPDNFSHAYLNYTPTLREKAKGHGFCKRFLYQIPESLFIWC